MLIAKRDVPASVAFAARDIFTLLLLFFQKGAFVIVIVKTKVKSIPHGESKVLWCGVASARSSRVEWQNPVPPSLTGIWI